MPLFDGVTPETIKAAILARCNTTLQTREGSYTNDLISPVSFELWRWCMTLDELITAFYVDEHSGVYLDKHAELLGLARKAGTRAFAPIHFTGRDGVTIPAGTVFFSDTGLQYTLAYDVTIQNGTGSGALKASGLGDKYNAPAGAITKILRNIPGLDGWTSDAAAGGTDPESDKDLFARIDQRRKDPATSGNEAHYREWAMSCNGVGAVKVTGLWNGPGTVRVLLADYDRQPVDQAVVDACAAYIQTQRPVGADVTVLSAVGAPVSVSAQVTFDPSTTLAAVQSSFTAKLDSYLRDISFTNYTVYTNRVASLLMGVDGVIDYANLLVNGGAGNVTIGETEVPVVGTVALV